MWFRTFWWFGIPAAVRTVSATTVLLSHFPSHILDLRAGIAQSVQRLATGWTTKGSEFECRWGQEFSLLHVVQISSGVHLWRG
jgi:hypothetical protein